MFIGWKAIRLLRLYLVKEREPNNLYIHWQGRTAVRPYKYAPEGDETLPLHQLLAELAQPNRLGSNFHQLIGADVFQGAL
jgi:hypothetical protein